VVPRRGGHHPAPPLARRQRQQQIQRASDLERPGLLQVLALQVDLGAHQTRERPARRERRANDVRRDPRVRGADVGEIDHRSDKPRSRGTSQGSLRSR